MNIIKLQKWYRGSIVRLKQMPLVMYVIKLYLCKCNLVLSSNTVDGRVNSCIDEDIIISLLEKLLANRLYIPKIRMWYDILVYDYQYGWLPVNIKTTTTKTNDNIGNLATCVYAYTDEPLILQCEKTYENGSMSRLLLQKLQNKQYNKSAKKDYYFLVVNKTNTNDIIINSIKGINYLTPNINNLPFQVCWSKNNRFHYEQQFIQCLQKPNPSWKELFLSEIRKL